MLMTTSLRLTVEHNNINEDQKQKTKQEEKSDGFVYVRNIDLEEKRAVFECVNLVVAFLVDANV